MLLSDRYFTLQTETINHINVYKLSYMYGLETMALTEKQQKAQVCENCWVRRIVE